MAKWRKQFDRWKQECDKVDKDEAAAILRRICGDRFEDNTRSGDSHEFDVDVHELWEEPGFEGGHISLPVKDGRHIKIRYIKQVLRALEILKRDHGVDLLSDAEKSPVDEGDGEQDG